MTSPETLGPDVTLADLAVAHAGATRVLRRHGLDFCCQGGTTLAESCGQAGLDPTAIVDEIAREAAQDAEFERWDEKALDLLIEHILERFHARHREDVARLLEMARKVEQVHAEKADCPKGLARHLANVQVALEEHMLKEEEILFPLFRAGQGAMAGMPVRVMEQEHVEHGRNLARLRELAHDYVAPDGACTTWKALYLGLDALERDVMQHVHLENNVLFPRALQG